MRLTLFLRVSYPKMKRIPGLKYEGKEQKTKPIKVSYKIKAVNDIMREEQNLKYLNNPYLTSQEEVIYGRDHPERRTQKIREFLSQKRKPFYPDKPLEEHFNDTIYWNKKWE